MHDDGHAERLRAKAAVAAQGQVEQLDDRGHVVGLVEADADRLACRAKTGIGRVDVELERVGQVPGDQGAHPVADVGRGLEQPHHGVEVGEPRLAERAAVGLEHLDGGAAGADVDTAAADLESPVVAEAGQGDPAGGAIDGGLDQAAREGHASVVTDPRALGLEGVAQPRRRAGHADPFQDRQGFVDDQAHVPLRQGPEAAAGIDRTPGGGRRIGLARPAATSRRASRGACHGGSFNSGGDVRAERRTVSSDL